MTRPGPHTFLMDMIFTQNLLIASTEDEATNKQGHPELLSWYHASMDATRKLSNFFLKEIRKNLNGSDLKIQRRFQLAKQSSCA